MQVTILCQFKILEILFPNINEGINCKIFLLWLYPQTHQLAIFTYSMKRVALASSQGLASLGFFPCAILFFQSQINNPDPQMFLFIKKKRLYGPFSWMGFNCLKARMRTTLEGSLLFNIKFPEIAGTHFLSTSEGRTTQIPKSDPKKGVSVLMQLKSYFPSYMKVSGTAILHQCLIQKYIN